MGTGEQGCGGENEESLKTTEEEDLVGVEPLLPCCLDE